MNNGKNLKMNFISNDKSYLEKPSEITIHNVKGKSIFVCTCIHISSNCYNCHAQHTDMPVFI